MGFVFEEGVEGMIGGMCVGGTGRKEKAHVVVGISIINELFQLVCLLACLVDYYRNMLCVYEGGSDYNWEGAAAAVSFC